MTPFYKTIQSKYTQQVTAFTLTGQKHHPKNHQKQEDKELKQTQSSNAKNKVT